MYIINDTLFDTFSAEYIDMDINKDEQLFYHIAYVFLCLIDDKKCPKIGLNMFRRQMLNGRKSNGF